MYYGVLFGLIIGFIIGMMFSTFTKEGFQSTADTEDQGSSGSSDQGSGAIDGNVVIKEVFPNVCERLDTLIQNTEKRFDKPPPASVFKVSEDEHKTMIDKLKSTHLEILQKKKAELGCP